MKYSLTILALLILAIAAFSSAAEFSTDVDNFAYDDMNLEAGAEEFALLEAEADAVLGAEADVEVDRRRHHRAARRSAPRRSHTGRALKKIGRDLKAGARRLKNKVKGHARNVKNGIKKDLKGIKNKLKNKLKQKVHGAKHKAKKAGKALKQKAKKAGKALKHKAQKAKAAIKKQVNKAKAAVKKLLAGAAKKMQSRKGKKHHGKKHHGKKHHGHKANTFKPKNQPFLKNSQKALRKSLGKVVNEEPESAAIVQAKNNWKWENQVIHRLDKYSPPDTKNLLARKAKLQQDSSETCGLVEKSCSVENPVHHINMNTCVLAKEACFNSRVAIHKVERAFKQCTKADDVCAKRDFASRGDCLVAKAQCKKFLDATNWSVRKAAKLLKTVRDREILDKDANALAAQVSEQKPIFEQKKKALEDLQPEALKCKETAKAAQVCLDNADFGPQCATTRTAAEKCEEPIGKFEEAKVAFKEFESEFNKLVAERNAAEALAKKAPLPGSE